MKHKISRFFSWGTVVLVTLYYCCSCTKADLAFGEQWLDNDYTKISVLDTITPVVSTVYLDSFPTNSTGYGLIGVYKDPYLGTVSSSTYVRLQPPSVTNAVRDSLQYAIFDSAVVYLKLKRNEYGDTTKSLTLNVYQLSQSIFYPNNNSTNLYNTNSFEANSTPIGSRTFTFDRNAPHADFGDTLLVRLNDEVGSDLFTKLKNYNLYIQNSTDFLNYFKGLKITGTAPGNDGFMMNVSDSIFIRVYYDVAGIGQRVRKYYDFSINDAAYQFNNISIDRTGTTLGNAGISRNNKLISSVLTDSAGLLQQSTQTAVKISFPTIQAIRNASNFLQLTRAVLVVRPVTNSNVPYYALPSSVYVGPTDYSNAYTESSGIGASPVMDASTRTYSYSYDITTYVKGTELVYDNINGRGLLLYLPASAYKSRVNRLIVGDARRVYQNQGIQLLLYYISVK